MITIAIVAEPFKLACGRYGAKAFKTKRSYT